MFTGIRSAFIISSHQQGNAKETAIVISSPRHHGRVKETSVKETSAERGDINMSVQANRTDEGRVFPILM